MGRAVRALLLRTKQVFDHKDQGTSFHVQPTQAGFYSVLVEAACVSTKQHAGYSLDVYLHRSTKSVGCNQPVPLRLRAP